MNAIEELARSVHRLETARTLEGTGLEISDEVYEAAFIGEKEYYFSQAKACLECLRDRCGRTICEFTSRTRRPTDKENKAFEEALIIHAWLNEQMLTTEKEG